MDAAHVSLVALLLRKDGFEDYHCGQPMTLGINLESMAKVLKCAGNDDSVTIKAKQDADSVTFIFESKHKVSDFELKILDIDSDTLGIPEVEYKVHMTLPAPEFQKIVSNLQSWGETVQISTSKKGVKFSVSGENGTGNIHLKAGSDIDSESEVVLDVTEDVSLTFALKKLSSFTKATPLSTKVNLSLSDDVPLNVEYMVEDLGYIRYYLAPKIEDDS